MLFDEGEELSLAQTGALWRHKTSENFDEEGLELLNQVKLGQGPVRRFLEEFPEFALSLLLLLQGHEGPDVSWLAPRPFCIVILGWRDLRVLLRLVVLGDKAGRANRRAGTSLVVVVSERHVLLILIILI